MRTCRIGSWKAIAALLGLGLSLLPGYAGAVCPSKKKGPGGSIPPGLRKPFDPPPEQPPSPSDPPPTPPGDTTDPSRPGPKGPTTPTAPPPATPTTPELGPGSGRERPQKGLDALDDDAWELWWGLNRSDVLPRVRRQADSPDGQYARQLLPELRAAMDAIIEGVTDSDESVREASISALAGFTTEHRRSDVLAILRKTARGSNHWHRDLCHLGLGLRKDAESAESMRKVLRSKHEEPVSRAFAALGLISLGDEEGMKEVEAAAEDLDEADVAGSVLIALGQTKEAKHLPRLMEAAKRKGGSAVRLRRVRADAIIGLGKHGDPASIPFLGSLLDDKEKVICRSAAIALGGFKGSEDAAALLRKEGLDHEDPFVRAFAAIGLGRIGNLSSMPMLAKHVQEEKEVGVRPFLLLGAGITRDEGVLPLLEEALSEAPRTGRFSAAALAAGLVRADDAGRARLRAALNETRKQSANACSALGLGLLGDKVSGERLRKEYWLDSTRQRPGFNEALSIMSPEEQSAFLVSEYKTARRSAAKQALAEALSWCGGPAEAGALLEFYRTAPQGDTALRVQLLSSMAIIINDRIISQPRSLLLHTYYLQPNDVLSHIMYLP